MLAAGASRRFGSDKLLHPYTLHGVSRPLIVHSLAPWLQVYESVSLIVRQDAAVLRAAIESAMTTEQAQNIRWVTCAEAAEGMGASIRCGVQANRQAAGWLIGLADMPALSAQTIRQVRAALASGASIAAPVFDGQRGHPVGFAGKWQDALLALQGDEGARKLLQGQPELTLLQVADAGIHHDVDCPADLP